MERRSTRLRSSEDKKVLVVEADSTNVTPKNTRTVSASSEVSPSPPPQKRRELPLIPVPSPPQPASNEEPETLELKSADQIPEMPPAMVVLEKQVIEEKPKPTGPASGLRPRKRTDATPKIIYPGVTTRQAERRRLMQEKELAAKAGGLQQTGGEPKRGRGRPRKQK